MTDPLHGQDEAAALRASRARLAGSSDGERLRLERELHDGAQQRLMAIQIKLALLRERLPEAKLAAELDEIAADADAAVDDLRRLANGIYPTVLRERGLADALRSLTRGYAFPVDVADDGVGRAAPVVESAIYACVSDAIELAARQAGPGARVTVSLRRDGGDIVFEVADDGSEVDPAGARSDRGHLALHDRIGAVGGRVATAFSPAGGTTVRGRAPAAGPPDVDG